MADESKSASVARGSGADEVEQAARTRRPRMTIDIYHVGPNGSRHVRRVTSSADVPWKVR